MPIRVRNWNDPLQRMLYLLDRDLDKILRGIPQTPTILAGAESTKLQLCPQAKIVDKRFLNLPPKPKPKEVTFEEPSCAHSWIYSANGHDWVCEECGLCRHANFEEIGGSIQYEQRQQCAPLTSAPVPYDRNKHFKKVLRDLVHMHIRIPKEVVSTVRALLRGKPTATEVRKVLRRKKLYHYYTSVNNIARMLGDRTERIELDTRAYNTMCVEANRVSTVFNMMKESGEIKRKNFVNTNVLIRRIAVSKFKVKNLDLFLRLPRAPTLRKHEEILDRIYAKIAQTNF